MNLSTHSVERLNKLADVLVEVPKLVKGQEPDELSNLAVDFEAFSMNTWGCGTAACAAGIAMIHPWFNKRGLKYRGNTHNRSPIFRDLIDEDALSSFFGISDASVQFLFMPNSYPDTHKHATYVADRIRKFVQRDGAIVGKIFKTAQALRF